MKRIIETIHEYITVKLWFVKKEKKKRKLKSNMIKAIETSKTIDREDSLSFEGVGRKKESVRLENGPKFPCVS